jgi:hypothetical protein
VGNTLIVIHILGFFLGDMSRPIIAESCDEQQERMKHVVVLPEEACPARIAL